MQYVMLFLTFILEQPPRIRVFIQRAWTIFWLQVFRVKPPAWVKYLQLRLLSHHGAEAVCALNDLCVYGKSAAEDLEDRLSSDPDLDNDHNDHDTQPAAVVDIPIESAEPNKIQKTNTVPLAYGQAKAASPQIENSHGSQTSASDIHSQNHKHDQKLDTDDHVEQPSHNGEILKSGDHASHIGEAESESISKGLRDSEVVVSLNNSSQNPIVMDVSIPNSEDGKSSGENGAQDAKLEAGESINRHFDTSEVNFGDIVSDLLDKVSWNSYS